MSPAEIGVAAAEALSPIVLALLTWVGARLGRLVQNRQADESLRGLLLRLDQAILTVVRELQQVSVDTLKAASAGGKLAGNVKEMLRRAAMNGIKHQVGAKALAELGRLLGLGGDEMERFIQTRVEAAVYEMRHARRHTETRGGRERSCRTPSSRWMSPPPPTAWARRRS